MTKNYNAREIVSDPIGAYEEFHIRLKKYGQMAPFPEFQEVVDFLISELNSPYAKKIIEENKILKLELDEVLTFLFHLNLKFKVDEGIDYPYLVPFEAPYPYRPTIDAIEQAIRFLDKVNRLDKNNKAVKLYHFDRYCYHRHALITNEDVILFPTIAELSMMDFIKTRCVPIEFVGVISRTMRVDGHQQSPLDFWYHDMNHARRLFAYILKRINKEGLKVEMEKYKYFRDMHDFAEKIIIPKLCDFDSSMTEEEIVLRKTAIVIIFEIVHETALTLEKDELIRDILRKTGPQPFEYMSDGSENNFEELRTPTGNLQSGASHGKDEIGQAVNVRYFFDPTSIGLLANIYSKINHYYYDDENVINENMIPSKYRTPENILKTIKLIFEALEFTDYPNDDELLNMILNREGTKEKSFIKPINEQGEDLSQFATEPLKADEVISKIQELKANSGKKVFTIFGYSAFGYENLDSLKETVKKELEKLSPKEYIINIGATEEGIGCAYEIAKKMGFETIGVVSTLALAYSGKFSDYVEKIYIVNDDLWGGFVPGTKKLAETTKVFLAVTDVLYAFGGGSNTAVTVSEAKTINIPTKYFPFEMNHEKAIKLNKEKIEVSKMDFKGEAFEVLG